MPTVVPHVESDLAARRRRQVEAARRRWSREHIADAPRWDRTDYPLWHDQLRMSVKLDRSGPDQVLVDGQGCWVVDAAGRRLLDARAGVANVQLGYGRRDIVHAMTRQAEELAYGCVIRYDRPALTSLRYAAELVAAAPHTLTRVRFTHMGSASVENALQMARLYHRNRGKPTKTWILSLSQSYHGSTLLTLVASGEAFIDDVVIAGPPFLARVPLPDERNCAACSDDRRGDGSCVAGLVDTIEKVGPDNVAALVVEPVMDRRVVPLSHHFLSEARRVTSAHDILLVYDEVITGFGRLGQLFAADYFGVVPDILCLAKGITAGYAPMGAVLVNEGVYAAFDVPHRQHFPNGSSCDGHPVACAAASAALAALLDDQLMANVSTQGDLQRRLLRAELAENPLVADVRGVGLLTGIELHERPGTLAFGVAKAAEMACDRRGVLVQHGHNLIVMYPPLVIDESETAFLVERVTLALRDVVEASS